MNVDKLSHAAPQDGGTRLFLGAQLLDVLLTLEQRENVLAGWEPNDGGAGGGVGFHAR